MPGLFVAQQIAGTANVEIVAGEFESRAQAVQIAQDFESFLCLFGDDPVLWSHHIGISARF